MPTEGICSLMFARALLLVLLKGFYLLRSIEQNVFRRSFRPCFGVTKRWIFTFTCSDTKVESNAFFLQRTRVKKWKWFQLNAEQLCHVLVFNAEKMHQLLISYRQHFAVVSNMYSYPSLRKCVCFDRIKPPANEMGRSKRAIMNVDMSSTAPNLANCC